MDRPTDPDREPTQRLPRTDADTTRIEAVGSDVAPGRGARRTWRTGVITGLGVGALAGLALGLGGPALADRSEATTQVAAGGTGSDSPAPGTSSAPEGAAPSAPEGETPSTPDGAAPSAPEEGGPAACGPGGPDGPPAPGAIGPGGPGPHGDDQDGPHPRGEHDRHDGEGGPGADGPGAPEDPENPEGPAAPEGAPEPSTSS